MFPKLDGSYGWAIEREDGEDFLPGWTEWPTRRASGTAKTALQASLAAGKRFAEVIERQVTEGLREAFNAERPTAMVTT
jgi:hypothetical protein